MILILQTYIENSISNDCHYLSISILSISGAHPTEFSNRIVLYPLRNTISISTAAGFSYPPEHKPANSYTVSFIFTHKSRLSTEK